MAGGYRVRPLRPRGPVLRWQAAMLIALAVAGCTTRSAPSSPRPSVAIPVTTSGRQSSSSTPPPGSSASSTALPTFRPPSPSGTPAASLAQRVLAGLTEPERVGQLFMAACPSTAVSDATISAITRHHVGSVILTGASRLSIQDTATITRGLQRAAPKRAGLFLATDQEGGTVQRLTGQGFSPIPSALAQGGLRPAALRDRARRWGAELAAAGINLDLAPVLDTVPSGFGSNPPIGDLDREYGHDPAIVATHGLAFLQGLAAAGVTTTVKHFPGLGRVGANTDTTSGVRDTVTTRHDRYLTPFATAIGGRVSFVMVSSAIYTRIDPARPAVFSPTVLRGMLRGDLGFRGVIISDDLGAARQVSALSPAARAVAFLAAGGDLVLTVDISQIPAMTAAVLARSSSDAAFRAQVDAAALRVLQAKQARGLLR